MLDKGIVVDFVHSTPNARKKIFEINDNRGTEKRPLVFSHTGIQTLYFHPLNPSDEEILKIQECGGVIGMIFDNYFQRGFEEDDFPFWDFNPDNGVKHIINTIKYIHKLTGTYDNIAIGSDLDGFTDPPDDLYNLSRMSVLKKELKKNFGNSATNKILGKNVYRVLQNGWGK